MPWQVETVWDLTKWQCAEVTARDPAALAHGLRAGLPASQVVFQVDLATERRLLAFSALRGFPHLTLEMLDRLWRGEEVKTQGKKPTLLMDVLRHLCEWVLGGSLSDEDWEAILARREAVTGKRWQSVVQANEELAKAVAIEKDHPEVSPAPPKKRSLVADGAEKAGAKSSGSGDRPVTAQSSSSAAACADAGPAAKRSRKIAPLSLRHYTQSEASAFLPVAKGVSISPVANRV